MLVSFGLKLLLFCLGFCLQTVTCYPQVCIPTWTPYPNSFSTRGSSKPSVPLLQDCLARCERLNNCVAVDFNLSSSVNCWHHYDISDLSGANFHQDSKDNVTQYRINRNCTSNGKGPDCPVRWSQDTSVRSYSGEQVNYWTEYDCFTYCLYSDSCEAVDYYNLTSPPCWIHKEQSPQNAVDRDGIVQYRLNKTCPSSTDSTSFQIGRCVGQYFPNTGWCPAGAKIHIEDAWFKVNPLCCYRNSVDAYPPDASWLSSIKVSYLDETFFDEINSSCDGQLNCNSSISAKKNAFPLNEKCFDGDTSINYVSIAYKCISEETTTSGEMARKTTGAIAATGATEAAAATRATPPRSRSTPQTTKSNSPKASKATDNAVMTKGNSDNGLIIGKEKTKAKRKKIT